MRGNRRLTRQRDPVFDVAHDEAGATRHVGPLGARIAHAPVEADTVAVDAMAGLVERFPDLRPGTLAFRRLAEADLRVHHHAALLRTFPFVGDLARDLVFFE